MDKSRTVNTARNAAFAWSGHILGILVTFVTRQIFVRFLSAEYLGLTGLFGNVLTVLSLVELGVGPAMVYGLYKPLAAGDTEKVRALMALLARAYRAIGLAVVALGLAFTPAYPFLMDVVPDIPGLNQIYWLFVLDTGASYCFAYKRALVTASQNRHIETGAHQFAAILLHLAQILALALTGSYIVFLLAQIAGTLLENALLTGWANRAFPYLRDKRPAPPLPDGEKREIRRGIRALTLHKVGGVAVNATDNLLIAKMLGLELVGVYANYQMVFTSAQTLVALLFSAMLPSVGNLGIQGDRRRMTETFRRAEFAGFYLTAVMAACLLSLVNPFVAWWVGEAYLLPEGTLLVLLANFYLKQMRLPLLTFRDATGSYRRDRFKPLAEAAVNLIASIWLARRYGLAGVFLGTIAGTVAIALVVEPVIVHRACLDTPLGRYYLRLFLYTLLLAATCAAARWAGGLVSAYTLFGILVRGTLVFAVANACLLPALWFTREGRFIRALWMRVLRALRRSIAIRRA